MGLLSGSVSVTRYHVTARPAEIDFDAARFRAIAPGSEVRESIGFVPFEPEADYRAGDARWAFRVRIDRLRPDPTAVAERVRQLVAAEAEATGAPFVGPRRRRQLRQLAEEELIVEARPRARIVEGVLDGDVLWLATTAKTVLGSCATLLRRVGVLIEPKAPWVDRGEAAVESDLVELTEPGQSVLGCRFLGALAGERDLTFEPEAGSVRLRSGGTRVTLTGAVLRDLLAYVERGAEVLAAKLTTGEVTFRLDGRSWRLGGLRVDAARHAHWSERLDERLDGIAAVFDLLDAKYAEIDPARLPAPVRRDVAPAALDAAG